MTDGPSAVLQALQQDEGFKLLAEMMEVSARFHFFVLVCDSPRVTRAALDLLRERVAAARGVAVRLTTLDPYASPDISLAEPLAPAALLAHTLPELLSPQPSDILVLDASRSLRHDDPAWQQLFQRMNEQRNTIVRAYPGSLVLCVPHALEIAFTRAAPDFWSIRSTAISLDSPAITSALPKPLRSFLPELLRSIFLTSMNWYVIGQFSQLDEARAHDPAVPQSERSSLLFVLTLRALVNGLPRDARRFAQERLTLRDFGSASDSHRWLAWAHCLAGTTEQAVANITECVESIRQTEPIDQSYLVECMQDQVQILLWHHHHDHARHIAHDAVKLTERMLDEHPGLWKLRSDLAQRLDCYGDVAYETGSVKQALRDYQAAVLHRLHVLEHLDARGDLINRDDVYLGAPESLLRRGIAQESLSDPEAALSSCLEAVHYIRAVIKRSRHRDDAAHMLAVHLGHLGELHLRRGDPPRADLALTESLTISRRLYQQGPRNIFWRHTLAASLMRSANFADETHAPAADELRQEAIQILEALHAEYPARTDWSEMLADCTNSVR